MTPWCLGSLFGMRNENVNFQCAQKAIVLSGWVLGFANEIFVLNSMVDIFVSFVCLASI